MEKQQLNTCNSQAWEESGSFRVWLLLLEPLVSWIIFSRGDLKGPQKW